MIEQVTMDIQEEGNITIISMRGELTLLDAPGVKKTLDSVTSQGRKLFLFDFEKLTFLDSSGVGLLLRFNAQLQSLKGRFAFINFHKSVANTMQKALPRHIREACYFETKDNALKYLTT